MVEQHEEILHFSPRLSRPNIHKNWHSHKQLFIGLQIVSEVHNNYHRFVFLKNKRWVFFFFSWINKMFSELQKLWRNLCSILLGICMEEQNLNSWHANHISNHSMTQSHFKWSNLNAKEKINLWKVIEEISLAGSVEI